MIFDILGHVKLFLYNRPITKGQYDSQDTPVTSRGIVSVPRGEKAEMTGVRPAEFRRPIK